jgi:hypothetical protein
MITGKYFAIIDYPSMCGTLHTRIDGVDTDYLVELARNRTDVTITERKLNDDGVMMSEKTEIERYTMACNDDTKPDELLWFLRGFSGIPVKTEDQRYGQSVV